MTTNVNYEDRIRGLETHQRELERRMDNAERELERLRSDVERRFADTTRDQNRLEGRINTTGQSLDSLKTTISTTLLISLAVVYFVALIILVAIKA